MFSVARSACFLLSGCDTRSLPTAGSSVMASYAITHGNARRARRAGSPTVNGTIQAARTYAVDFVLRAAIGSVRPWPKTGVVLNRRASRRAYLDPLYPAQKASTVLWSNRLRFERRDDGRLAALGIRGEMPLEWSGLTRPVFWTACIGPCRDPADPAETLVQRVRAGCSGV